MNELWLVYRVVDVVASCFIQEEPFYTEGT